MMKEHEIDLLLKNPRISFKLYDLKAECCQSSDLFIVNKQ